MSEQNATERGVSWHTPLRTTGVHGDGIQFDNASGNWVGTIDGQWMSRDLRREYAILFAAAPKLLRELKEMVSLFGEPDDGMERDIVDAAKAAIKKATKGA